MPLYMDINTVDSDEFSAEDVVKAHMEDLVIQQKFGVRQIKYWVNEKAKTIFCLMEGPNKEACHQVHLQSHGSTACNIIEVSDDEYNLYMGQGSDRDDLATTDKGELDPGYRTILMIRLIFLESWDKDLIKKINLHIKKYGGRIIIEPNDWIMVTFMYAYQAIHCGLELNNILKRVKHNFAFNMALVSGKPVDEEGNDLFEITKRKAYVLSALGLSNNVYLDQETIFLSEKTMSDHKFDLAPCSILSADYLNFVLRLFDIFNMHHLRSDFDTSVIFNELGASKSAASRKIKAITSKAPNQLIQEFKLLNAVHLILRTNKTMA